MLDFDAITLYESRFWSRVEITEGCWLWMRARTEDGYGRFRCKGGLMLAHKFSYLLAHKGHVPKDKPFVLHHCDNPPCVNPSHLYAGTHSDNMRDRSRRNRANLQSGDDHYSRREPYKLFRGTRINNENAPRGEKHPKHKLTAEDVLMIRANAGKVSERQQARDLNVSASLIHSVLTYQSWRHVA